MTRDILYKIYGVLSVISFITSIIAIVFSISDIECSSLEFSIEKGASLIGIFVSVVGLVISLFFVILAFDAYSKIKEISGLKESAEIEISHIQQHQIKINSLQKDYAQLLFDNYEEQIALATYSKSQKMRNALILSQARLSYKFPMLDKLIRKKLLTLLGDIGEVSDVHNIEYVAHSDKEDLEIKEHAGFILGVLKKKFDI